jgi:hypothetical protein
LPQSDMLRPRSSHANRPVRWRHLQPPAAPAVRRGTRVVLGHLYGELGQTLEVKAASCTGAKSDQIVYVYHAKLVRLRADFTYLYGAMHYGRRTGVRDVHLSARPHAVQLRALVIRARRG